jgi:AraC-like DNA-binding protein/mannose-6-phosphate isomerase-like protein (cupin superfamily)
MSTARHLNARHLSSDDEQYLTVRSLSTNWSRRHVIETHSHSWHQLLCAFSGAMTVQGGRSSWIIPPGKAVFIPAGATHSIHMWGEVAGRSLYFPPATSFPAECRALDVSPLLRELVLRVIDLRWLDSRNSLHRCLLELLLHELNSAPASALSLPLPKETRALKLSRHCLAEPASALSINQLSRNHGLSRRTLERIFRNETGLSFGMWRQKARLLASIRLLAEGQSVTTTALDSGYASPSAFIASFRRTFGHTPGQVPQKH